MYPNNRRNFTDTLKRPTDVRPLDGDVLIDTDEASPKMQQRIAELKRLLGKDRENLRAAVEAPRAEAKPLGGIAPQPTGEEMNRFLSSYGNAAENPQAFSEARRDLTGAQLADAGYRFHGGSWTPRPGDDLNAKLGTMQPTDAAGPFSGGMGGDREANLRNSLLAAAQAEAKRNADMEAFFKQTQQPASVQAEKIKNDPRYAPGTTSATGEYHSGGSEFERGKALNAKGAAMQAQNAEAETAYNAQRAAQGAGKRLGTTPVMAAAVMNSGLLGGEQPEAGTINPGMAVLAPDVVKSQMEAQSAATQATAQNAAETGRLELEREKHQADIVVKAGQATEARLMDALAKAATDEQRAAIRRDIESNRSQIMNALLKVGSLPPEVAQMLQPPDIHAALSAPGATAGSKPVPAAPVSTQTAPPTPTSAIGPLGRFPAVQSAEELPRAEAEFKPSFEDLWAANLSSPEPWALDTLGALHSANYRPPAGAWRDADGDGVVDVGEVSDQNSLRYHLGRERSQRILATLLDALDAQRKKEESGFVGSYFHPSRAKAFLTAAHGNAGDDAVRWALARSFNRPDWIKSWNQFTYDTTPIHLRRAMAAR